MTQPPPSAARRNGSIVLAALLVVGAALIGVLVYQTPAPSSAMSVLPNDVVGSEPPEVPGEVAGLVPTGTAIPRAERAGPLGEADGVVPDGSTVFDDGIPGVANLDPDLLAALRRAAIAAADDGVEFFVDSGWRSQAYQEQLLQEAIARYGSAKEAARWVSTPDASAHVTGDAVDIGHADARAWLSRYGAEFGLCQVYRNEPWHYELRPEAVDHRCPRMYADSSRSASPTQAVGTRPRS
jgi:D-alanyl-D-alanine carboxypeptidase